jgi:hypothetical protein
MPDREDTIALGECRLQGIASDLQQEMKLTDEEMMSILEKLAKEWSYYASKAKTK